MNRIAARISFKGDGSTLRGCGCSAAADLHRSDVEGRRDRLIAFGALAVAFPDRVDK